MAAQAKTVIDRGGAVIEILAGRAGGVASRTDLDTWIKNYKLGVSCVIDAPGSPGTLKTYGIRESAFIVDVKTMRIVEKFNGSVAGIGDSAVKTAIAAILKRL